MKKRTISKLKSIFGSKSKGKRHKEHSNKSRSPSPEIEGPAEIFRPIEGTPPPPAHPGPPPSPPVPTQPRVPVAPQPNGPLPLSPCQVCGRTFVPESLAKHAKICERMTVKKRKTFDSSRQRREGTDLEQFLPKNFGLPENSPFAEKSPAIFVKTLPKTKPQSVRSAITKPMAELQRCPHCSRAFGPRAFERHVEWCADKAKILPAAPAQQAPCITEAKQRLNARTQYKAPPVRGRRSSQSRDKSSMSRSTSVDSTRDVSPPPAAKEFGECRGRRIRASESLSSNDDASPHVPVIRNTRTLHNSSGDANVKARQARLARDLSTSRNIQKSKQNPIPESNSDLNTVQNETDNKVKNILTQRKQQQLKKLEVLAQKYKDRNQKYQETRKEVAEKKRVDSEKRGSPDKSQIPIPNKKTETNKPKSKCDNHEDLKNRQINSKLETVTVIKHPDINTTQLTNPNKRKPKLLKAPKTEKNVLDKSKIILERAAVKESTMSLDSLEEEPALANALTCQNIGIHITELNIPCVKKEDRRGPNKNRKWIAPEYKNHVKFKFDVNEQNNDEKVELLFQNLNMTSSTELHARQDFFNLDSKEDFSISNLNPSLDTLGTCTSENFITDEFESQIKLHEELSDGNFDVIPLDSICHFQHINEETKEILDQPKGQLSQDNIHDIDDLRLNLDKNIIENDQINEHPSIRRQGSGETYTKFTEDPLDLEEFINVTDKLMTHHTIKEKFDLTKDPCVDLHTPDTSSITSLINAENDITERTKESLKHSFSDTLEELKANFQQLMNETHGLITIPEAQQHVRNNVKETEPKRKVSDLEHIKVYELDDIDEKSVEGKDSLKDINIEFKLPSIMDNKKSVCKKKKIERILKPNKKYKMLGEQMKDSKNFKTYIVEDNSDNQSTVSSEAPPFKLPRIEQLKKRIDDNYDPFLSAARQMKELMSSDTNIPNKLQNSKDLNRTLPILRPAKEKANTLRPDNTKQMKNTINKNYQKTPTLQRMKSFGSTNNDNSYTFGARCSSFRLNRNESKKSSQPKLSTTFTKSSKENISSVDKNAFNRNSNLNRSFSSYNNSSYSTPKPREKIPKIATSYHSFQRTTIKQPVKLNKIKKDEIKKEFVNLDSILADDNSSMTSSTNYIDPRLINENDNLPINVNTILNNPDMISSMESLLTTENLPAKFDSFNSNTINNNFESNSSKTMSQSVDNIETNNMLNNNTKKSAAPTADDLSAQYKKLMSSLTQSIASKTSIRDDESLCEDFDLEEFMTSFDDELHKQKTENKRTCSSTTRVVKQSDFLDSNKSSKCSTPASVKSGSNGFIPFNKSMSFNFSSNNITSDTLFPSSVKRSTSLLDSIQRKNVSKTDSGKNRQKVDQLEQDIMQSLKDFDKFYETESNTTKETVTVNYNVQVQNGHGIAKRESRLKNEKKTKKPDVSNGNYTPNGKSSDSAYSSLNRISPSKLSICNPKETNCLAPLDQIPATSDSSGRDNDVRSVSSDEFLAMERSAELDEPITKTPELQFLGKDSDNHKLNDKRTSSRQSSRQSPAWRPSNELSSSGSESSLHKLRKDSIHTPTSAPRLSRFCHECGNRFPVDTAKFCIECGVKRLVI